jgi:outer membrane protein TolC
MMSHRLLSISVCLLATATAARAQENLTLGDATARALSKNHSIRIEREAIAAATARMSGAAGEYDPKLRLDFSGRYRRDPATSLFSGAPAGDVAPFQNTFDSNVSVTQLFKTGATASLSTSVSREGTNGAFTSFAPAYLTSLGVDLRQPLLRHRAIDPARAALRVTVLDRDRSSAALERQVLQTVSEVESAYWSLVEARRDLNVRRGSLALAEAQRADTQVRIEARTVPVSDFAQPTAEVERRRGDLFAAQEAVARAERALKQLMIGDAGDPLWTAELTPADDPEAALMTVDVTRALSDAERNRPEFAELGAQISGNEVDITLARDSLKPRLDLVAGYSMRGLGGSLNQQAASIGGYPVSYPSSLQGGPFTSWRTLADQKFPDATIGFSLELPIGNHAARGELGVAQARRRQSETALLQTRERIAIEVRNAATALETAAGRIQAARAGLAAAETQLRAEQDRFGVGLSTNFFVLTRQNDLALAQLAEIRALTDYQKAVTELGRATGTLLRDRGIHVN